MLIDSHCHLNFKDFNEDLEEVLNRAREMDVKIMQTICTKISEFPQILEIANKADNIYASVGIHPHEVEKEKEVSADEIVKLTQNPKVIGVGETGLDYFYEHAPRKPQQESFIRHIEAARKTQLPVIIHTRDADDDTIAILENEMKKGEFSGLIHCFTSTEKLALKCIELGLYISISGIITFKNAVTLQETVKKLPMEKLLVETDSPFLAPVPKRGKRNEPGFTKYTAEFLANLKGISYEECARITTKNFFDLFSKVPNSTIVG